jgi:hypothetical protein
MVVYANRPTDTDLQGFWVHTIMVETFEGTGASGDVYAVPQYVAGFLEGKNVLVRDAAGNMVTAGSTFYTDSAYADLFTPDTRVTIDGRVSYVITQNRNDSGSLGLPDHTMVQIK